MARVKLKAPTTLNIDFSPSPRQYEVWRNVQPECPECGGEVSIELSEDGTNEAICNNCGNDDIPQMLLSGGAAGGGKSYLGSVWLISSCIRFADIRAVVARKTLKALKESTMNTIFSIMRAWGLEEEEHYHFNQVEGTIRFWNNSVIIMKEMADIPSDPNFERFGSSEYTIAFIDECSEMSEKSVEVLFSRLRWNIGSTFKVSKLMMSTNPTVNWVRDRFVQDNDGMRVICRPGEIYIPFKVDDNPDKAFVAHYKRSLQKIKDVATRERLLEGNWDYIDANEAAFYNGFNGAKHLETRLKERVYDANKPLILSFDFNVHPFMTCLVAQVDYEKQEIYFLEEILGYPKDKLNNTPALSKFIFDKYKKFGHKDVFVITGDPAGLARNSQTQDGVNNFSIIRSALTGLRTQQKLLRIAPPQTLRGEWINELLTNEIDGWKVIVDLRCRRLTEDLIYQLSNEDGSKDKSKVKDPKTGVKYEKYGHCFAPETLVTTINGDVPIKNVKVGDMVMTRNGFKKVTFSGVTKTNAVVKDYYINGHRLVSTTDHPYYTSEDGFVDIDKIKSDKTFITNNIWREKQLLSMGSHFTDTQRQIQLATGNILGGGLKGKSFTLTDMSGRVGMGKFQTIPIFTTSMAIVETIEYSISYVSQQQSICQSTPKNAPMMSGNQESQLSKNIGTKRQRGIQAKKVLSGTKSMVEKRLMGKSGNLPVQSAELNSQLLQRIKEQSIAGIGVEKELPQEYLELSTIKAQPISKNSRVLPEVYDITVEDDHEFFANGILVHNCSDAFDYTLCLFVQTSWYKYKRGGNDSNAPVTATMPKQFEY